MGDEDTYDYEDICGSCGLATVEDSDDSCWACGEEIVQTSDEG